MITITLKDLENNRAYDGVVKYFKSLKKDKWELMDLCYKCLDDGKVGYFNWLCKTFKKHFNKKDAGRLVQYSMEKG